MRISDWSSYVCSSDLDILAPKADHVLGDYWSIWRKWEQAFPLLTGQHVPQSDEEAWRLLRNPLPDRQEHAIFDAARRDLRLPAGQFTAQSPHTELDRDTRLDIKDANVAPRNEPHFFPRPTPLIRPVLLLRRALPAEKGLNPGS